MIRVAVLDDNNRLIGADHVAEGAKDHVEIGDLPTDGSYKWSDSEKCFIPLGHGFGKPSTPPCPIDHIVRLLITELVDSGKHPPEPIVRWAEWYDENLLRRNEEKLMLPRKGKR